MSILNNENGFSVHIQLNALRLLSDKAKRSKPHVKKKMGITVLY